MADPLSVLVVLGLYFIYIADFHSIMPKHHGLLKRSLVSHGILFAVLLLIFLVK